MQGWPISVAATRRKHNNFYEDGFGRDTFNQTALGSKCYFANKNNEDGPGYITFNEDDYWAFSVCLVLVPITTRQKLNYFYEDGHG